MCVCVGGGGGGGGTMILPQTFTKVNIILIRSRSIDATGIDLVT